MNNKALIIYGIVVTSINKKIDAVCFCHSKVKSNCVFILSIYLSHSSEKGIHFRNVKYFSKRWNAATLYDTSRKIILGYGCTCARETADEPLTLGS